jgi:hypothetical protein
MPQAVPQSPKPAAAASSSLPSGPEAEAKELIFAE